jgi:hypothetical protein
MNETAIKVQRRRTQSEIEQIVAEFADSGLNRSQFCRGHRLTLGTLNRYLRRRREEGDSSHGGLIAVELAGPKAGRAGSSGLTLLLSAGRRIEVGPGFDTATLERLLVVLERR